VSAVFVNVWRDAIWNTHLDPAVKLTALAMSRYADYGTGEDCYPGTMHIALDTGFSGRHVSRLRIQLERLGWIETVTPGGRRGGNRATKYRLIIATTHDIHDTTHDTGVMGQVPTTHDICAPTHDICDTTHDTGVHLPPHHPNVSEGGGGADDDDGTGVPPSPPLTKEEQDWNWWAGTWITFHAGGKFPKTKKPDPTNPALIALVIDRLNTGWMEGTLADRACVDLPAIKGSATGLLIKRLTDLPSAPDDAGRWTNAAYEQAGYHLIAWAGDVYSGINRRDEESGPCDECTLAAGPLLDSASIAPPLPDRDHFGGEPEDDTPEQALAYARGIRDLSLVAKILAIECTHDDDD